MKPLLLAHISVRSYDSHEKQAHTFDHYDDKVRKDITHTHTHTHTKQEKQHTKLYYLSLTHTHTHTLTLSLITVPFPFHRLSVCITFSDNTVDIITCRLP